MRLEVTRRSDLAIRSLIALTSSPDQPEHARCKTAELAQRIEAAPAFVNQVMKPLVQHRWVDSVPGPTGGYRVIADLNQISVLEVIEAVEGPTDTDQCVVSTAACGNDGFCALHDAWQSARDVLLDHLGSTPVACAARRHRPADKPQKEGEQ